MGELDPLCLDLKLERPEFSLSLRIAGPTNVPSHKCDIPFLAERTQYRGAATTHPSEGKNVYTKGVFSSENTFGA